MQTDSSPRASRVVVSYPADMEPREVDALDTHHYRMYLRRTLDRVDVGDERDEFVNCGCGTRRDVVLRVAAVEGGTTVDEETEVEFVARDGDELTET